MTATSHRYGDHPHQFGELTLPPDATEDRPAPVVVLVHGGFWRAEVGLERMQPLAPGLAERGWASWNVEYRRLGADSQGGWPRTADDVSAAIDHVAALAADGAPVDPGRVVTVGHSAGGHLVLLDAARDPGAAAVRVRAVVGLAPLTDVAHAHGLGAGVEIIEAFMGGAPDARAAEYAAASPVTRVPLGVPQVVVQGASDEVVPPGMVADYVDAARAAGDAVAFDLRPGVGHFDLIEPDAASWAAVLVRLETALDPSADPSVRE